MTIVHFNCEEQKTKFAPNLKMPIYVGDFQSDSMISALIVQSLKFEKQIMGEELVSEVPLNLKDPYPWTRHWKQHNIFWDASALGSEHLERFEMSSELEKLFHVIRKHYLLYLKELNYPREKVYIHGWVNILRKGEWISLHHHTSDGHSYVSGTYYLTDSPTTLALINPIRVDQKEVFQTVKGRMIMFPSYVPHESTIYNGDDLRVSIAFDITGTAASNSNPWRPHVLFDDPATMDGLEMYLKDRSLTAP